MDIFLSPSLARPRTGDDHPANRAWSIGATNQMGTESIKLVHVARKQPTFQSPEADA